MKIHAAADTAALAAQVDTAPTTLLLDHAGWGPIGARSRGMFLDIFGSDASVDITGPVEVQIWDPSIFGAFTGRWVVVDVLDGGALAINVGTRGKRWAFIDAVAGALAVRLAAVAVAGGTIDAYVTPFEVEGPE